MKTKFPHLLTVSLCIGLFAGTSARAALLNSLYAFPTAADGANPLAVVKDAGGSFYGITMRGGTNGEGTVFKATSSGTVTKLHDFGHSDSDVNNGGFPRTLLKGSDGQLYGATKWGNAADGAGAVGHGKIFTLATNGTAYSAVFTFTTTATEGADPTALIQGVDGNLYGVARDGGANGDYGTVFQVTTNGTFTLLYSFGAVTNASGVALDGSQPHALVQGVDSVLYGVTEAGGTNDDGTIFSITTNGTFAQLHSLDGSVGEGRVPQNLVQGVDGHLYGTAQQDYGFNWGLVFKTTTNGTYTVLNTFSNSSASGLNGVTPVGNLIQADNGRLYGSTQVGGAYNYGTIFMATTNGGLTNIVAFNATNGATPNCLVQAADGNLYGVTTNGGGASLGTFFSITNITSTAPTNAAPAGQFSGLFLDGSPGRFDRCGLLTFTLKTSWAMPVKISMEGRTYTASPTMNHTNFTANFTVVRAGMTPLDVTVHLDSLGADSHFSGTVSNASWTATLSGDRAYYFGTNPPQLGSYSAAVNDTAGNFGGNVNPGWGSAFIASVKTNGGIAISGKLSDDAVVAATSYVAHSGDWPLYIPLYSGKGALFGWMHFDTSRTDYKFNTTGTYATWVKTNLSGAYYIHGFTNSVEVKGALRSR